MRNEVKKEKDIDELLNRIDFNVKKAKSGLEISQETKNSLKEAEAAIKIAKKELNDMDIQNTEASIDIQAAIIVTILSKALCRQSNINTEQLIRDFSELSKNMLSVDNTLTKTVIDEMSKELYISQPDRTDN